MFALIQLCLFGHLISNSIFLPNLSFLWVKFLSGLFNTRFNVFIHCLYMYVHLQHITYDSNFPTSFEFPWDLGFNFDWSEAFLYHFSWFNLILNILFLGSKDFDLILVFFKRYWCFLQVKVPLEAIFVWLDRGFCCCCRLLLIQKSCYDEESLWSNC